jgi:hypothetical protein
MVYVHLTWVYAHKTRKLQMELGLHCFFFSKFQKFEFKISKKKSEKYIDVCNVILYHSVNFQNEICCIWAQ